MAKKKTGTSEAYNKGVRAGIIGRDIKQCPYKNGTPEYNDWIEGYKAAAQ